MRKWVASALAALISAAQPTEIRAQPSIQPMLECRSLQVRSFAFEPVEKVTSAIRFVPGWSEDASEWKSIALLSTTKAPDGIDVVQTMSAVRSGTKENAKEFRVDVFADNQVLIHAVYVTSIVTFNFFRLASPLYTWGLIMTGSWAPYGGSQAYSLMVVSTDCH